MAHAFRLQAVETDQPELVPSTSVIRSLYSESLEHEAEGTTDQTIEHLLDCVARALEVSAVVVWLVREGRALSCPRADSPLWTSAAVAPLLTHALATRELLLVPDLALDPRFIGCSLVSGPPHARFFAAAPLCGADGTSLGAICAIDPRPSLLSAQRAALLTSAANVAVDLLALSGTARALARLEDRERTLRSHYQIMFEDAPLPMYRIDCSGTVLAWNAAAARTFGWSAEEAVGTFLPLLPEGRREEYDGLLAELQSKRQPIRAVQRSRVCKNGELRSVLLSLSPLFDARGELTEIVAIVEDVTERERASQQLLRVQAELLHAEHARARMDALTGLANRLGIEEAFARESERARRTGAPLSIALFDIDHFKELNDQHGHAAGDSALKHIANVLAEITRPYDLAARWGGDELLLIVPGAERAAAVATAERVRTAIAARSELAACGPFTLSGGVAEWVPGEDLESTVARADAQLYAAKAAGRNQVL